MSGLGRRSAVPASPPAEVLAGVARASARASELAAENRELNFRADPATGRLVVEVRDLQRRVIRTIPPSRVLEIMAGGAL